ncbi:hypothetical protein WJX72_002254 [[Myrmecia] bisecta]|uniref:Uncharacterized protein n=1 Tax=[Myrmecia] bisecta TaxID=41462 RepID=A0AAW1PCU8_9CHLO
MNGTEHPIMHGRIWKLRQRVLGPDHADTLYSLAACAASFAHCEDREDRGGKDLKALMWRLGVDHTDTRSAATDLAVMVSNFQNSLAAERDRRGPVECRIPRQWPEWWQLHPEHSATLKEMTNEGIDLGEWMQHEGGRTATQAGAATFLGTHGQKVSLTKLFDFVTAQACLEGGCPGGAYAVDLRGCAGAQSPMMEDPDQGGASAVALEQVQRLVASALVPQLKQHQGGVGGDKPAEWQTINDWLHRHTSCPILLVLEHAEDALSSKPLATGLQQLLPSLKRLGVRLLLTCRCTPDMSLLGLPDVPPLELDSLSPEPAVRLLTSLAGEGSLSQDQAESLSTACGRNALALTIIAGFISSSLDPLVAVDDAPWVPA